jgi:hypothetical protein
VPAIYEALSDIFTPNIEIDTRFVQQRIQHSVVSNIDVLRGFTMFKSPVNLAEKPGAPRSSE